MVTPGELVESGSLVKEARDVPWTRAIAVLCVIAMGFAARLLTLLSLRWSFVREPGAIAGPASQESP